MKKTFVRILALCLALLMLAGCGAKSEDSAAGGSGGEASAKHYKIGVIEVQLNDESTNRATWFREVIAPAFNCEFMFS